jgi:endoglucanase
MSNPQQLKRGLRLSAFGLISSFTLLGLVACGGSSGGSKSPASSAASSSLASSVVSSSSSSSVAPEGLTLLHADGAKWAKASGNAVSLKGTNLGNWLMQEFWMMDQGGNGVIDQCTLETTLSSRFGYGEKERLMKLFHDSWITERDWDQLQSFGFNIVRVPIMWNLVEDEKNPKTLRTDAWQYIDWAIAQGKKRGIYVILDLHGAQGGQTSWQSSGCSNQNKYWTTPELQDRAKWLWQQMATHYKDEPTIAAYDLLNEPWGSTPEDMATRITELYTAVRAIDPNHIILLPSHFGNIDVYGNPTAKGMTNVAFEIHPYPGLFGDRPGDSAYDIHRDWLRCGVSGTGGVCDWNTKIKTLNTPLLVGEFQPWQSAGLELGGKITRATYDTYASYGWAATSWAYKLVSNAGGQGKGTWGMVTNAVDTNKDSGVGLVAKASTWDCANWNSSFADACGKKATTIKVGGTGSKTYYFVIKVGALDGSNPDVSFDNISIVNTTTQAELINNGGFGANTGWTEVAITGTENIDYNNTAIGKIPTGGIGASLRITRPMGVTGLINGAIYQAITLEGGQSYTFSGTFKDNGSVNTWAEMYLVDQVPVAGKDVVDMTGKVDFTSAPIADIEKLFKSFATQAYDVNSGLAKYLPTTPTTIYTLPKRPTGLKLVQGTGNVALNWIANSETDLTGYKVYRGNTPSSGTLLAEGVKTNTYTDSTAVDGVTYYYTVSATDAEDESYRSDEAANKINYTALPGKVEAEAYSSMFGIQLEDCSDIGGTKDVGYFDPDDYIEFKVSVATAGNFTIDYRLATANGSTGFEVLIDGVKVDAFAVPNTGGWQSWKTYTSPSFALTAGNHSLRFKSIGKEWNINYFEVKAL